MAEMDDEASTEEFAALAEGVAYAVEAGLDETSEIPEVVHKTSSGITDLEDIDMSELVKLRRAHQMRYAETGVRVRTTKAVDPAEDSKRLLGHKLYEILKQEQDRGIGTGLERTARWKNKATETKSGNAANAAAVAKTNARKVRSAEMLSIRGI